MFRRGAPIDFAAPFPIVCPLLARPLEMQTTKAHQLAQRHPKQGPQKSDAHFWPFCSGLPVANYCASLCLVRSPLHNESSVLPALGLRKLCRLNWASQMANGELFAVAK